MPPKKAMRITIPAEYHPIIERAMAKLKTDEPKVALLYILTRWQQSEDFEAAPRDNPGEDSAEPDVDMAELLGTVTDGLDSAFSRED